MRKAKQTKAFVGVSWRQKLTILFVVILLGYISPMGSSRRVFHKGPLEFFSVKEASAQPVDPSAKSKYDAGLAAMNRGDCQTATTLFKQAIGMDPHDRTVRIGMFSTDYYPNAKLQELQAKCPSAAPLVLTLSSPQGTSVTVQNQTDQATVAGLVQGGEGGRKVSVNGKNVPVGSDGRFSTSVPLNPGANDISVSASDSTNKVVSKKILITRLAKEAPPAAPPEKQAPPVSVTPLALNISSPTQSKQTVSYDTDSVVVKGSVEGGKGRHGVVIGGKSAGVDSKGFFSQQVPLQVGRNRITVKATDTSGATKIKQYLITRQAKPAPPAAPAAAPLILTVTSPSEPRQFVAFETDKVDVEGSVKGGEGTPQVTVNNKKVRTDRGGSFSIAVPLEAGDNKVTVVAKDSAGKEESREFVVRRLAKVFPPPVLSMASPVELKQSVPFETDKIEVAGSVKDGEGTLQVTVNDKKVRTGRGGSFTTSVPLEAGENKVTVVVKDAAGKEDSREFVITRLAKVFPPPVLTVTSPSELKQSVPFEIDKADIAGSVKGGEGTPQVTVNSKKIGTSGGGSFTTSVPLEAGENKVTVVVKDAAGKEDSREFVITRLAKVFPPPVLTVTSPSEPKQSIPFETEEIVVGGSVKGGEGVSKVTVNNREVKVDSDGFFSTSVSLHAGDNEVTVAVKDSRGREDTRKFLITRLAKVFPPPVLAVASPSESERSVSFETDKIAVGGTVAGGEGAIKITVNDKETKTERDGSFSVTVPLHVGENKVTIRVEDSAGRKAAKDLLITRNEGPPPVLRVSVPTETGEDGKVSLQGTVSGGAGRLKLTVDGQEVPVGNAGAFTTRIALKSGRNRVNLQVEDSEGRRDSQVWFLFNYPTSGK